MGIWACLPSNRRQIKNESSITRYLLLPTTPSLLGGAWEGVGVGMVVLYQLVKGKSINGAALNLAANPTLYLSPHTSSTSTSHTSTPYTHEKEYLYQQNNTTPTH